MATPSEFAREADHVAHALRRLPKELRRELAAQVKDKVAVPLAADIAAQSLGPWRRVLAAGSKARSGADPKIVVGGKTPRLSGGAGPRDVVFGTEFGGGNRTKVVPSRAGVRGHQRHTTRQFRRNKKPFVYPTIQASIPEVLDRYADIVLDVIDREVK